MDGVSIGTECILVFSNGSVLSDGAILAAGLRVLLGRKEPTWEGGNSGQRAGVVRCVPRGSGRPKARFAGTLGQERSRDQYGNRYLDLPVFD